MTLSERDVDPGVAMRISLFVIGAAALAAGIYGRFRGIGLWPVGVDEFYISRSIDNVLRTGLPQFPCGGYYTRGVVYQYAVAGLRLLGSPPEFAGRFVAAVSSLALLPAVYLLGRRLRGTLVGALAVIILCVSIWEIEMARFARMYAPFQAVFAWYLVAYLRYTVDADLRAARWMVILSILGVLTWEGGVLVGVANILAVVWSRNGRLEASDWRRLAGFTVLLVVLYLATRDFRGLADMPVQAGSEEHAPAFQWMASWFAPLGMRPSLILGMALPLICLLMARRWLAGYQGRWSTLVGLCVALAAAFVHAFLVSASLILLMLLLRLIDRRELSWRQARFFWMTLGACGVFWMAVGSLAGGTGIGGYAAAGGAAVSVIMQRVADFPDVFDKVLRPWARTLPVLSLALAIAMTYSFRCALVEKSRTADYMRALLGLSLVLVLAIGAIPTERVETRYSFFLYPPAILIAVTALVHILRRLPLGRSAPAIVLVGPLLCFGATEDFQPNHLAHIDSAWINFRTGMSPVKTAHYYPRTDMRGAGEWLQSHVQPGDIVISGVPSLDEYYSHIDYVFLSASDERYEAFVCGDGKTDRWSNRPVAYTDDSLKPWLAAGHRVYASLYASEEDQLTRYAVREGWTVTPVWKSPYGGTDLILISRR